LLSSLLLATLGGVPVSKTPRLDSSSRMFAMIIDQG
jgi:hypothetical protein